jgi:hypothetical protein
MGGAVANSNRERLEVVEADVSLVDGRLAADPRVMRPSVHRQSFKHPGVGKWRSLIFAELV